MIEKDGYIRAENYEEYKELSIIYVKHLMSQIMLLRIKHNDYEDYSQEYFDFENFKY